MISLCNNSVLTIATKFSWLNSFFSRTQLQKVQLRNENRLTGNTNKKQEAGEGNIYGNSFWSRTVLCCADGSHCTCFSYYFSHPGGDVIDFSWLCDDFQLESWDSIYLVPRTSQANPFEIRLDCFWTAISKFLPTSPHASAILKPSESFGKPWFDWKDRQGTGGQWSPSPWGPWGGVYVCKCTPAHCHLLGANVTDCSWLHRLAHAPSLMRIIALPLSGAETNSHRQILVFFSSSPYSPSFYPSLWFRLQSRQKTQPNYSGEASFFCYLCRRLITKLHANIVWFVCQSFIMWPFPVSLILLEDCGARWRNERGLPDCFYKYQWSALAIRVHYEEAGEGLFLQFIVSCIHFSPQDDHWCFNEFQFKLCV